ncbi:hypothetical protein SESBI_02549 [Sesbania bispinosa]|nr:hypothetical protein SESBI_02549 [Sesbania bispinosa]
MSTNCFHHLGVELPLTPNEAVVGRRTPGAAGRCWRRRRAAGRRREELLERDVACWTLLDDEAAVLLVCTAATSGHWSMEGDEAAAVERR